MLETIQNEVRIQKANKQDFNSFYWSFITTVQDENIKHELSHLHLYNDLSIIQLDKLIEREMVSSNDIIK